MTSYYCTPETKTFINSLNQKEIGAASFCLKINLVTLTGQKKSQAHIEEEVHVLLEHLDQRLKEYRVAHSGMGSPKKKKGGASSTSVPFFDIEYQAIVEALRGKKLDHELELAEVDAQLPLLKDMFGLKCLNKSVAELRNESVVPLGALR